MTFSSHVWSISQLLDISQRKDFRAPTWCKRHNGKQTDKRTKNEENNEKIGLWGGVPLWRNLCFLHQEGADFRHLRSKYFVTAVYCFVQYSSKEWKVLWTYSLLHIVIWFLLWCSFISGANCVEQCFNISRDILYSVFFHCSCTPHDVISNLH